MSVEILRKPYHRLGLGTENLTLLFDSHPDRVIKFARQLYISRKHLLDERGYSLTKDRVKENLDTIRLYVDEQFLPKTAVQSCANVWWTKQEKLPVSNYVTSKNIVRKPQLIPEIIRIIDQTKTMHEKTGYYIDWFGFNRMDEIIKLLTFPGYWSIPNLVIEDNQLKVFDLGLYRDNNSIKDKKYSTVSPLVDSLVCKLQLYLIEKVRGKMLSSKSKK